MIGKDQIQNRMYTPTHPHVMTVDQVVREFHVTDRQVRHGLKKGDLIRVPTTHRLIHMTRRSVERYFSPKKGEE